MVGVARSHGKIVPVHTQADVAATSSISNVGPRPADSGRRGVITLEDMPFSLIAAAQLRDAGIRHAEAIGQC